MAAVLKTVDLQGSGGSNPSLTASKQNRATIKELRNVSYYAMLKCRTSGSLSKRNNNRDVAQLVAHVVWDHRVAGSSPVIPTTVGS